MSVPVRLCLFFSLVLASSAALATPPLDCTTPRHAVDSLFGWQQPRTQSLSLATRCLEPGGRSSAQLEAMARRIKAVFDARALYVVMETLPLAPDFVNEASGQARVVVHPALPEVVVVRQDDGLWRWPMESQHFIDTLYANQFSFLGDGFVDHIPEGLKGTFLGVALWQYLALLFVLLMGLVVRKIIQVVAENRLKRLAARWGDAWGVKLVKAVDSPGATLIMTALLALSYPHLRLPIGAALAVEFAVRLLFTVSLAWAAYRLVDVVGEAMAVRAARTESKLDDQLVPLVRRTLKVLTVIVGALFVLQNMDVDVGSLLAGLGIGGVAVALAAKDTIANLFGSVMIFTDKPFQIGDWVLIEGAEGIVEEVGFRTTRIRTFYNSLITIPNQNIANAKVDNYGARTYRRTYVTVSLSYDTTPEQLQAFCEGTRAIIKANPFSRKDYYEVHFSGFGEHSLNVMLYFFFKVSGWNEELRERHNVFMEVLRLAHELKIRFAVPTHRLHLEEVAEPGRERIPTAPPSPEEMQDIVTQMGPGGALSRSAAPFVAGGFFDTRWTPPSEAPAKKSA